MNLDFSQNNNTDIPLSIIGFITNNGELCGYRLSNNRLISCEEGLDMVKSGQLQDIPHGLLQNRHNAPLILNDSAPGTDHP